MRHSAATDRVARSCLAEGDGILRARRMEKNHRLAFPESNLQSQRFLVKARRAMDVADVQVDVIQHARRDHWSYLPAGRQAARFTRRPPAKPAARSATPARDRVPQFPQPSFPALRTESPRCPRPTGTLSHRCDPAIVKISPAFLAGRILRVPRS